MLGELDEGSFCIALDDRVTEAVGNNPFLSLMKLMLSKAFTMSHNGLAHSSSTLDEAENPDVILIPVARGRCMRWMMRASEEGIVAHDGRLLAFTTATMLRWPSSCLLADGTP